MVLYPANSVLKSQIEPPEEVQSMVAFDLNTMNSPVRLLIPVEAKWLWR